MESKNKIKNDDNLILKDVISNEEALISELEIMYKNNRKEIILGAIKEAKKSDNYHKVAISSLLVFITGAIINIISLLTGHIVTDTASLYAITLQIIGGMGAVSSEVVSSIYEKQAYETGKEVKVNDAVIEYKNELNSENVKSIIKMISPKLFSIIDKIQLSNPINITTFNQLNIEDQQLLVDEAVKERRFTELETGLKYINMTKEENKDILEEAKRRRFIK